MNCVNHPETAASAFCRECGKPMCADCQRPALGSIFCDEHVPAAFAPPKLPKGTPPPPPVSSYSPPQSPYTAPYIHPAEPGIHPALALILGFAPGVGAICNGQYAKGLVHAVIFGVLVTAANQTHGNGLAPLLGIMIAVWVIYQAFEAYHTARKRRYGIAVEEFSSLLDFRAVHGRLPAGAIVLIGLGFILLLDTTNIIPMRFLLRFWPALLIFFGVYLLYSRSHPIPSALHPGNDASGPGDGSFRR